MPPSVGEPAESGRELLDSPLESARNDRVVERDGVAGAPTAPLPIVFAAGLDNFGSAFFGAGGVAGFAFRSGFAAAFLA